MTILIIAAIIGLILFVTTSLVWNFKYGRKYIEISVLPLRKKYRNIGAFGLILIMVAILTIGEFYGFTNSYEWMLIPAILISNNQIIFEPYYTTDIIEKLDDFCLYLRPFVSDNQYNWGWMNENLEKRLCGMFNKRVAKCFCIGDPNAAMPTTLSTSGIYAADSEWQDAVKRMSEKSKVIIIRVMKTNGCIWEMKNCINNHLDKTVFLISDSKDFELLKEFIADKEIEIPNVTISNNGFIALFYNGDKWNISLLSKNFDIKEFINKYVESHKELEAEVKCKNLFSNIAKAPFQPMEIERKWLHYIAFIMQPLWYITFNRWPRFWISVSIIYALIAIVFSLSMTIICDIEGIYIVCWLIFCLLYMWIAPRITTAFNKNGSKHITQNVNRTLLKWILIYNILLLSLGCCIPKNIETQASDFVEEVMSGEGYNNYTAIETSIDSLSSSIYTDKQVRIYAAEYLQHLCDENADYMTETMPALFKFYDAIENFKFEKFAGWEITHRFSHYNANGEYVENRCMIIADKDFENYFIYSLDKNEKYYNYFDYIELIDELLSDEFIEEDDDETYLEEIEDI